MPTAKALAEGQNFGLHGQLATSYNDNVTLAHTRVIADVIEKALIGIDLKKEGSRNSFLAQMDLSHDFYFNNSSFNNTVVVLKASDRYELSSRMRVNVSDSYQRAQEPQSFDDAFGRNSGRYRTDQNRFNVKYECDLSQYALFELTYANEFTGYSRSDLDNTVLNQIGPRFQYAFDDANRLGMGYIFSSRDFESGALIQGNSVVVDFGHNFTKQLQLVLKVGEDFVNDESTGNSQHARYEVSLLNEIDVTTHAQISYKRGLNSYAYSKDLFDSYQVSGALGRELTARVSISGAGFYGKGEYQQSRISDELLGAGAQINYAFSQQVQVGLNYNFAQTLSNRDVRSYHRNFVGAQVQIKL